MKPLRCLWVGPAMVGVSDAHCLCLLSHKGALPPAQLLLHLYYYIKLMF